MIASPRPINPKMTIIFAVIVVLLSLNNSFAQSDSATLRGTVVDQNGGVVAGAKVTVSNDAKAFKREAVTDEDGNFTTLQLPPEAYVIKVEQTGFAIAEVINVKLNANDQRQIKITLNPAGVMAAVKVEESAIGVELGAATSTTVSGQLVERLPLNGRSFQSLLYQVPGVVPAAGDGQISVNGNRTDANYFTIDGVSANIGVGARQANVSIGAYGSQGVADQRASGSIPGFNASGSTAGLISVDALQEFKIQTSTYSAEFGRQPGGQVQITSKSGANDFHFTAFEYFRNEALDANDWFSNANPAAGKRSPLRQNDFGGTFSGPLYLPRFGEGGPALYNGKDKTFFFASFEALRLTQPQPSRIFFVPAKFIRDGQSRFNSTIQSVLNAFPLPNAGSVTCSATGAALPAGFTNPCASGNPTTFTQQFIVNTYTAQNTTAMSLRVDHKFNDKWNVFGRVNYAPSDSRSPLMGNTTFTEVNTTTVTTSLVGILSKNVVNDFRFNWSHNEGNGYNAPSNEFGETPPSLSSLLPNIAPSNSLANLTILGSGFQLGAFSDNRQRQINIVDGLSITKGAHTLKFGADYRRLNPEYAPREYVGTVNISNIANAIAGLGTATVVTLDRVPLKIENYSFYAQDTWKAGRRLTLDLGLRWDINPAPVGTEKPLYTLTGLGDLTKLGLTTAPPSTIALSTGKLYPTKFDGIAPRIGAAYEVFQTQGWETVLRGGFGIYYDTGAGISANAAAQFPYSRQRSAGLVPFPLSDSNGAPAPPLSVTTPIVSNQEFTVIDPEFSLPRSYQWTLTLGQNLFNKYSLNVSYVGNQGRRLLRRYSTQLPTNLALNPNFQGARLNITTNNTAISDSSDYHAMQVQFNRRLSNSWQFLSNYTWAHAIDTGSDDVTASYFANGANPQIDRGNSAFDRRHVFNLALSYDSNFKFDSKLMRAFLNGWTTDFIFKAQSASPFSVTYNRVMPAFGTGGFSPFPFRVDAVPGVDPWIYDSNLPGGKRLNPAAFTVGADVSGSSAALNNPRQGTSTRNGYYGFGLTQLDFAFGRRFPLGDRLNLSLKAEIFNITNTPNFATPSNAWGSYLDFGSPFFSANDPCVVNKTLVCNTFGRANSMLNRSFGGSTGSLSALNQIGGPRSVQLTARLTF